MPATQFAIVGTYQYMENYGDDECPRWKYKGGHEEALPDRLSIAQACNLDRASILRELEGRAWDNGGSRAYLIDWRLEELGSELIESVYDALKKAFEGEGWDRDYGYVRYKFAEERSEFAFDWAVDHLVEQGRLELGPENFSYRKFTIK